MMRFNMREQLPVIAPYRLDLTVAALRRLAANVVDVVDEHGVYYRALQDDAGTSLIAVTQPTARSIEVRATGSAAERFLPTIERMLGTRVNLRGWQQRAQRVDWLAALARDLAGLKPPRYPTLWEACAHAVVFQQISIHAAGAIMRRMVEALGEVVAHKDVEATIFPSPQRLLSAPDQTLRLAGLSLNKREHLRSIAGAILSGDLVEAKIDSLPTPEAAAALVRVRGLGPWSASVVLLRGLGRLDTFPMRDSGVARSVRGLAGEVPVHLEEDLETLGPLRGMLYYHLLLSRMRNLVGTPPD